VLGVWTVCLHSNSNREYSPKLVNSSLECVLDEEISQTGGTVVLVNNRTLDSGFCHHQLEPQEDANPRLR